MSSINQANIDGAMVTSVLARRARLRPNQKLIANLLDLAAALGQRPGTGPLVELSITQGARRPDRGLAVFGLGAVARFAVAAKRDRSPKKSRRRKSEGRQTAGGCRPALRRRTKGRRRRQMRKSDSRRSCRADCWDAAATSRTPTWTCSSRSWRRRFPPNCQDAAIAALGGLRQDRVPEIILTTGVRSRRPGVSQVLEC